MSPGALLIDGYNVLHAAGLARRSYGPGEFEKRRANLIRLISQQLSASERQRTTVVFDATDRSVLPSPPQVLHDILVLFADEGGDADSTIERLIQQNSAPRRLCVVSSDHRLQRAARRRRAKFVDSEVFLQQLAKRVSRDQRRRPWAEPDAKRTGQLPPAEVEAWLRVFDQLDQIDPCMAPDKRASEQLSLRPTVGEPSPERTPDGQTPSSPAPHQETDSDATEIEFWETRIRELWDDK